jgi:hypothetical protein
VWPEPWAGESVVHRTDSCIYNGFPLLCANSPETGLPELHRVVDGGGDIAVVGDATIGYSFG